MKDGSPGGKISFRWYLIGIIVLIILIVNGVVFHFSYQSSRLNLESEMLSQQEQSEFGLIQSIILVDQGLVIFDRSLDYRLKEPMAAFLAAYEESGGDPSAIDLEALKASFGDGYELYIINEAGVVVYTTYTPDHLFDFSQFPLFMERLTGIREGNVFVADRITQEFQTGLWRKYVYHPTPDHRYILEISYMDDEIQEIRSALRFTETIRKLEVMNPYLTSVRIFNWVGDEVGNSSYTPEEWRSAIITDVLETGEEYSFQDPDSGLMTRYLKIDLSANDNPPEMNLVAELTYSEEPIRDQLNLLLLNHLIIALIAVLTGAILAFLATDLINRPILQIVEDTRTIADGELDHPIGISGLPEFQSLSLSIQMMVDRLKDMMAHLQASEEELIQQNEELDARVKERTADLQAALCEQKLADERYKTLFREMLDGFVQTEIIPDEEGGDPLFRIIAVNRAFEMIIGIPADNLRGQGMLDLFPGAGDSLKDILSRVAMTGTPAIFEHCFSDDGRCLKISAFRPEPGQLACIVEDVSEERRIGEEMKRSLREKEVLIKEIHHRVKNNMQVVSGLLMLQRKNIQDESIRKIFQESESRVFTIALVHEKLYESRNLSRIEYGQYLATMGDYILGFGSGTVSLEIDAPGIFLSIDKAVPLSLITNELLTNSLKHAFPDGRRGRITISMRQEGETIIYRFSDDGIGLPDGFDSSGTASLGMQLINSLVLQLMGQMTIIRDGTTTFEIVFPAGPDGGDRDV